MTLYKWSQTASADATADSTVNWMEGQAPSSVNDSGRAMMAAIAKYRDDVAGAIVTSGTSTAYSLSTYQAFQSLSQMNGQVVAFTPHATNGATVTLNIDSLGAKPLRPAPNVELPAGTLIQGTPYAALYSFSDAAFYLHGFFGNPYNVPVGASIDYWGAVAPNSSFVLAYGQAISRTTYSTLFSLLGTTYGTGDGSSTFNIPDIRGRVIAGKDDMGGSAAARLSGSGISSGGATTLGGYGGSETKTLGAGNLPAYTPSGTVAMTSLSAAFISNAGGAGSNLSPLQITNGTSAGSPLGNQSLSATGSLTFTGNPQGGTSAPFTLLQPTIIANKLLRII